ncbi:MAG: tRNA preQ1(34) S-adenosylmethionine ribosyltransferase-isomerase QueA [Nanoarchaeota archaeon]
MKLSDFNYTLPKELIAQRPASPRTHSGLMVLQDNSIKHKKFYNLLDYLQEGDVLVINETKVLKIKLEGKKETGGKVELMLQPNSKTATVKGRVNVNDTLTFPNNIQATINTKKDNKVTLDFNIPLEQVMQKIGQLPTPPYIKQPLQNDQEYQTIYALKDGSFAAPTAGLHFDNNLLQKIKDKGIKIAKVCLHVSWDTFLPVTESDPIKHEMHGELCSVDEQNAEMINNAKRLFVVGTTTLRTLESFAENNKVEAGKKLTKIFIYPGYKWKLNYKGLITNFHLPKSTLLMMISAFYDRKKILEAYEVAIKEKYRFYSLGDAMLIFKT